ncbi:GAP family protein [Aerococcus urinaeequi]|uniref:GAP family protein n=1 Tax=Aerococcus urinaeequi TaxID=51665 RepID=UPI00366D1EFD
MWALLTTTIAAAFADSINPIAIAQQILLQSISRKKWHIWGFIIGIALTNFAFGMIVYFGFADYIRSAYQSLAIHYPNFLAWASLIIGILLLIYIVYSLYSIWLKNKKRAEPSDNKDKENNKQVTNPGFWKLFGLGIVSCAMELTSALPYIAYIAILIQSNLSGITVISILIFYNLLFSWPLIVLYFASVYYERYFTRIYTKLMTLMDIILTYVLPVAIFILGIGLTLFGMLKI